MTLYLAIAAGVLGSILASFAGVIAERWGTGDAWSRGRSRCNACDRTLGARDLVPLLSYLSTRGACRFCGARVPLRYPLSEALLGLAFFSVTLQEGPTLLWAFLLLILFVLAVIVLYDLRHTIVPMPLALVLLALTLVYGGLASPTRSTFGLDLLIAGSIGLAFFLLYACSGGRAMGLGDAPVALSLSLLLGERAYIGLIYSFWIGAVIGIVILVRARRGHRMGIEVPFVPFLAAGYVLALITAWNPFLL